MSDGEKDPALAAVASALFPGLGQFYNGQVGKGVLVLVGQFLNLLLLFVLVGLLTTPIVWAVSIYDAYASAQRLNESDGSGSEQDRSGRSGGDGATNDRDAQPAGDGQGAAGPHGQAGDAAASGQAGDAAASGQAGGGDASRQPMAGADETADGTGGATTAEDAAPQPSMAEPDGDTDDAAPTGRDVEALRSALTAETPAEREAACSELGRLARRGALDGDQLEAAVGDLEALRLDPEPAVSEAAAEALRQVRRAD